jgi:hypothetical protein
VRFYVCENWTHKKARVHRGDCGCCNDGRGLHVADSGRNGRWLAPLFDLETAMAAARALKQPDVRAGAVCLPSTQG